MRCAASTVVRSSRRAITSADSMAMSVPWPMAMPTSACIRAGASLIPSPTIATREPAAWSSRMSSALPPGGYCAVHPLDTEVRGHAGGGTGVVTGHQHGLDAHPTQLRHHLARLLPHSVAESDRPQGAAVGGHRDQGVSAPAQPLQ